MTVRSLNAKYCIQIYYMYIDKHEREWKSLKHTRLNAKARKQRSIRCFIFSFVSFHNIDRECLCFCLFFSSSLPFSSASRRIINTNSKICRNIVSLFSVSRRRSSSAMLIGMLSEFTAQGNEWYFAVVCCKLSLFSVARTHSIRPTKTKHRNCRTFISHRPIHGHSST